MISQLFYLFMELYKVINIARKEVIYDKNNDRNWIQTNGT